MPSQTNSKLFSLLLIAALIIGLALVVAINSEPARTLGIDILVQVAFNAITVTALIYVCLKRTQWQYRVAGIIFISILSLQTVSTVNQNWSRLPWVRSEAFNTANSFMADLKTGNSLSAMTKLTVDDRCVNPSQLLQPNAQPISWTLTEMDKFSNILGTAIFADGKETRILLRMKWLDNRWQIDGMVFGTYPDEKLDIDLLSYRCQNKPGG